MFKSIRAWFKDSEVLFLARASMLLGSITMYVGYMDFSPLWSLLSTGTDFTWKQLVAIGISIIGAGITVEAARRHRATDL